MKELANMIFNIDKNNIEFELNMILERVNNLISSDLNADNKLLKLYKYIICNSNASTNYIIEKLNFHAVSTDVQFNNSDIENDPESWCDDYAFNCMYL